MLDQTPLTLQWLESVGGGMAHGAAIFNATSHLGAVYNVAVTQLKHGPNAGRWEVTFVGFPFKLADTCGEIVRLCRELGIPLVLPEEGGVRRDGIRK